MRVHEQPISLRFRDGMESVQGWIVMLYKTNWLCHMVEAETQNHENVIDRQNATSAIQRRRERWNGGLKVGCDP